MIARFCGAVLGLLAFGVATIAGLAAGNPPEAVLSRSLWALIVFCVVGLIVGTVAQAVVNEYLRNKREELFPAEDVASSGEASSSVADSEAVASD